MHAFQSEAMYRMAKTGYLTTGIIQSKKRLALRSKALLNDNGVIKETSIKVEILVTAHSRKVATLERR